MKKLSSVKPKKKSKIASVRKPKVKKVQNTTQAVVSQYNGSGELTERVRLPLADMLWEYYNEIKICQNNKM